MGKQSVAYFIGQFFSQLELEEIQVLMPPAVDFFFGMHQRHGFVPLFVVASDDGGSGHGTAALAEANRFTA